MTKIGHIAGDRVLRLLLVVAFGLTLAACDKCSVPTWQWNRPPGPPTSCHDDAPVK
jgi:hypothetical protein